ncbi:predicted protein [Streptomyces pristinaespiralis ATCC 25486]|uniref:Predicted protein n=1 Tax=Streptomyces pristinaespiralis (strain ATCC 25486 / DSM 40338 / CBS 914.69 / JCM 4507 / KCC S-0507 / NBRC 13074 / NRRL 2958 / 5647) TaxID=457429 RepID=D6X6U3_STRE2|nr:predicted protein [Streptomyces pristinaespiralis ATCC 25486]
MPRGILGSLLICTVLYVAVSLVVTGMQHYTELSISAPLADAFKATGRRRVFKVTPRSSAGRLTGPGQLLRLG